jgi:hypothetical protein
VDRVARDEARYNSAMVFSPRLPHLLARKDLVQLLAPTYARARGVDAGEAAERLERALASQRLLDEVHGAVGAALAARKGPRTSADAVVDRISAQLARRVARAKPAEATPAISAVLVRIDLETGLAPESMRDTLASPRGRPLLEAGWRELGDHLARELLR